MPKVQFDSKAEAFIFQLIPDGDYIFEVIKFECGIQGGTGVTKGSDVVDLRIRIFNPTTKERMAEWTESFIFHEKTLWKAQVFMKCANVQAADGQEVEWTEANLIGLRGWCTVGNEPPISEREKKENPDKRYNRVKVWLTDKEKLTRNMPQTKKTDCPF